MSHGTKSRRWRVIVLSAVLVMLVVYTGCDWLAGRRVARALDPLEARYGQFAGDAPQPPKVPAPENRARLVRAAAALVNPGTTEERNAVLRFVADPTPRITAELRAYLQTNAEALRLAREFVTRTRSGFDVDYRSSGDRPPLLDMRNLSYVIYMAALQSMEARQHDDAAALITAGLAMSSAVRHEPDLITQLIRVAAAEAPMDALQRLIEEGNPSKTALEQVARVLAENREPLPMTIGLLGEVKHFNYVFWQLEAGRSSDTTVAKLPWPVFGRATRPLLRWAHARYLEQARTLLESQTGPRPRRPMPDARNPPPWAYIARMSHTFTAGLLRAIQTGDDFASQQAAGELVVALRRSKLDRGAYPDALSAIVPAYLPDVPIDPFTGQPPVYARDGDGFTLTVGHSDRYSRTTRPTPIWTVSK